MPNSQSLPYTAETAEGGFAMTLPPGHTLREGFLTLEESRLYALRLENDIQWERHSFHIFGRQIPMPRQIAFYGPFAYAYSGTRHAPAPFPSVVEELRNRVEVETGLRFNTVLLNRYADGGDSMGWHSDDDYEHAGRGAIASVNLGESRFFSVRKKDRSESWKFPLPVGSLLNMTGASQRETEHCLPKTKRPLGVRYNLTFRYMAATNDKKKRGSR